MTENIICRYKIPCDIDVFKYDFYLNTLKQEKILRENFLLEKNKNIQEKLNNDNDNNIHLEELKNEYENYIKEIIQEKNEQKKGLENINSYIQELIINSGLTNNDVQQSKKDTQEIINEILRIKEEINSLNLSLKC